MEGLMKSISGGENAEGNRGTAGVRQVHLRKQLVLEGWDWIIVDVAIVSIEIYDHIIMMVSRFMTLIRSS
jgi:hypothetical protein